MRLSSIENLSVVCIFLLSVLTAALAQAGEPDAPASTPEGNCTVVFNNLEALTGQIVKQDEVAITLRVQFGLLKIPMGKVLRIDSGTEEHKEIDKPVAESHAKLPVDVAPKVSVKSTAPKANHRISEAARRVMDCMYQVREAWKVLVAADYAFNSSNDTAKSLRQKLDNAPQPADQPPRMTLTQLQQWQSANSSKVALIHSLKNDISKNDTLLDAARKHVPEAESALADKLNALEAAAPENLLPKLQTIRNEIPSKDKWKAERLKDRKKIGKAVDEADGVVKEFLEADGQE